MQEGVIFNNRIIDVAFVAGFLAQIYKVITILVTDKKIDLKRFFETGGMPSSHSSIVTSLTTSVALSKGVNSTDFAISFIFMGIVMYDASGIRRAAGKHAGLLNKFLDRFYNKNGEILYDGKLKELLGHTPLEVLIGAILGVCVALVFKGYIQA